MECEDCSLCLLCSGGVWLTCIFTDKYAGLKENLIGLLLPRIHGTQNANVVKTQKQVELYTTYLIFMIPDKMKIGSLIKCEKW